MGKLEDQVSRTKRSNLTRRKIRYAYARQKGFSSYEANMLAGHSEKHIDELFELKKPEKCQEIDR